MICCFVLLCGDAFVEALFRSVLVVFVDVFFGSTGGFLWRGNKDLICMYVVCALALDGLWAHWS